MNNMESTSKSAKNSGGRKKLLVFHSADLDGITSGAVMLKAMPDGRPVPYDYHQDFPMELVDAETDVYMADVSVSVDDAREIAGRAATFVFIDHHATAIADWYKAGLHKLENVQSVFPDFIFGVSEGSDNERAEILAAREMAGLPEADFDKMRFVRNAAGCALCWNHLFPHEPMPSAVKMLGTYDIWMKDDSEFWDNYVMPFQYRARLDLISPDSGPYKVLLETDKAAREMAERWISEGHSILKYQKHVSDTNAMKFGESVVVRLGDIVSIEHDDLPESLNAVMINSLQFNSMALEDKYERCGADLMICYAIVETKPTKLRFGFYSTREHVNCGKIAKLFGGGGHRGAAGCTVKIDSPLVKYLITDQWKGPLVGCVANS